MPDLILLGLLMAVSAIAITGQITPSQLDPDNFGRSQLLGAFIPILLPITIVLLPLLDFGLAIIRLVVSVNLRARRVLSSSSPMRTAMSNPSLISST